MQNFAVIDDADLERLVHTFYVKVRSDPLVGPVFNSIVDDWDGHHGRLVEFWSSVMNTSGRYKGNPMRLHLAHADSMTRDRFNRWLEIWQETTAELFDGDVAAKFQNRASRIAESLQLGIEYHRPSAA